MEGIGERKRKAAALVLDWDKLLKCSHEDDEPLPLLVVEKHGKESSEDDYLGKFSDKELIEKINRTKRSLGLLASRLPDGGEKLRANLKRQKAELERRKLQKDDAECTKMTHSGKGTSDSSSPCVAPISVPAKSNFALCFGGKLDAKEATKSFSEELSTLNHCDNKYRSCNGKLLSQRTQKMSLSSRQKAFKSPLTIHAPAQLISKPSESQPLCNLFDKDTPVTGFFAKKENASLSQDLVNSRRNKVILQKTVILVDEEELEVDAKKGANKDGGSCVETRIYYPSRDDPEAIEILYSDMECLAPEAYLSSTIMNFYIQYLQKPLSPTVRKRCDYHFFNTYFYKKLKRNCPTKIDEETSHSKIRRWWKGVNIFEKAYIFVPIHENLHWSLVIICIPNNEDELGPIILHLDSLGLHNSRKIFDDMKSLLIEEWKFLRQEEVLVELPIRDNIWNNLPLKLEEKVIEVPQQRNEYDCGLFVLYFMERIIEEAPERLQKEGLEMFGRQWFRSEEASRLRTRIRYLLREEFNNSANTDL